MVFRMPARGAYGFAVSCEDGTPLPDLVPTPDGSPQVLVSWSHATATVDLAGVDAAGVYRLANRGGGLLEVDLVEPAVRIALPTRLYAAAVVHPVLTTPLAFLAHRRGGLTLHGGAFVADGRAWLLTGAREVGKSSMLTALGRTGHPIVADDLVVIEGGSVRAGPACVDLRADTAKRYPEATSIGIVSGRERFRLAMSPAASELPFGGAIVLEWHDGEPVSEEMSLQEKLQLIDEQHYARPLGPPPPESVLDVFAAPMWRFRRPRDWAATKRVLDQVLRLVASCNER